MLPCRASFHPRYRLFTGDHDGLIFVWNVSDGRGGVSGKKKKKTKKELAAIARENGLDAGNVDDAIYTVLPRLACLHPKRNASERLAFYCVCACPMSSLRLL